MLRRKMTAGAASCRRSAARFVEPDERDHERDENHPVEGDRDVELRLRHVAHEKEHRVAGREQGRSGRSAGGGADRAGERGENLRESEQGGRQPDLGRQIEETVVGVLGARGADRLGEQVAMLEPPERAITVARPGLVGDDRDGVDPDLGAVGEVVVALEMG